MDEPRFPEEDADATSKARDDDDDNWKIDGILWNKNNNGVSISSQRPDAQHRPDKFEFFLAPVRRKQTVWVLAVFIPTSIVTNSCDVQLNISKSSILRSLSISSPELLCLLQHPCLACVHESSETDEDNNISGW